MIPLSKFVSSLRRRWLEKTVFTRTKDKFTVAIEELPPLIAPSLTGTAVNTEMEKKSVYLTPDHDQPTGLIFASFISNAFTVQIPFASSFINSSPIYLATSCLVTKIRASNQTPSATQGSSCSYTLCNLRLHIFFPMPLMIY